MVWEGISNNGTTRLIFVKSGVKINAYRYITDILKRFIKEDLPKLYPKNDFYSNKIQHPVTQQKLQLSS